MSFFDDEGDEPPTRAARPRRSAAPRAQTTGTRARGGAAASDSQQLMVRRAAFLGVAALLLILVVVGINGCLDSRTKNALRDYNRNVAVVVGDSNDQVSKRLFELLSAGAGSTIGQQQNVNQIRVTADEDVKRARAFSVPGAMTDAQYHLLAVLTLRAGAVTRIAELLPDVAGSNRRAAVSSIAGQMQAFLASDVLYSQRVAPYIKQALDDQKISGQTIAASQFLPDLSWLDPAVVGNRLGVAGAGRGPSGAVAPGLHGHGLTSVKVGTVALQPQPAVNRVPATASTAFSVEFQNQGENDEFDVTVKLSIRGSGRPINVQKRVDQTKAGQPATAQVALGTAPPIGTPVRVTVTVDKVPGEKKTDNNTQTYTVIFTR